MDETILCFTPKFVYICMEVLYSYFVNISKQLSVSFCTMQCCSSVIGVTWNLQDSIVLIEVLLYMSYMFICFLHKWWNHLSL